MEQSISTYSYLSFKLGDEIYASNVSKVLNILEMAKITKVPRSPEYLSGIINLRGEVLPIVDLRMKMGMSRTEPSPSTCILVMDINIEGENVHVGGLVDGVQEVLEIDPAQIKPAPNIGKHYNTKFINGMHMQQDEFIMILEMDLIFSTDDLHDLTSARDMVAEQEIA